jgi:putative oxidoreductase
MSTFANRVHGWQAMFVRAMNSLQSTFLLVIRLYFGWQFALTGWGKLHNLSGVTQFFASLGIPAPGPTAAFVSVFEFVGGILLALGLLSRITALGIVIDMTVAYLTADRDSLMTLFSSDSTKFFAAAPFTFWFVGLIVLIFGPGKYALDALFARRQRRVDGVTS